MTPTDIEAAIERTAAGYPCGDMHDPDDRKQYAELLAGIYARAQEIAMRRSRQRILERLIQPKEPWPPPTKGSHESDLRLRGTINHSTISDRRLHGTYGLGWQAAVTWSRTPDTDRSTS